MAMKRYANAMVVKPYIQVGGWDGVRVASKEARLDRSFVDKASSILGTNFDPKDYLLTHCTIVASVDTYIPKGVVLGKVEENGRTIQRTYPDFRITPETAKYINNNDDFFERKVLLKAYKTFIGAHNFCFPEGTTVLLSDGTSKDIKDIVVGESVISHTGSIRKVTRVFERDYQGELVQVFVGSHTSPIECTPNHPFYVAGNPNTWIDAGWLVVGDLLVTRNIDGELSPTPIHSLGSRTFQGKVYNFEVEEDHSYVVDYGIAVHNCEHVQDENLSKGRILDAVARDIGDSVYIDILVATNRKHTELIEAILSEEMNAMSMGCRISMSQCTKCGNVAVDETEQCLCLLYQKGNYFYDDMGVKHKIAESCGHHSIDPTGGVTYEEASWVGVAAFKGAALRGIVNVVDGVIQLGSGKTAAFKIPDSLPDRELQEEGILRAASLTKKAWDEGNIPPPGGDEGEPAPEGAPKKSKDRIKELEDGLYDDVVERVRKRVKDDLTPKPDVNPESTDSPNDTIIKQAEDETHVQASVQARTKDSYRAELTTLVRTAKSDKELVCSVKALNESYGLRLNPNVYRVAFLVGPHKDYENLNTFKRVASYHHKLSEGDMDAVLRLSRILSFRR